MIICKCEDMFIIKVYKEYTNNFDMYDIDSILELFKNILSKLKNKYEISGLCYIDVYVNNSFGMIIEVNNIYKYDEDIDAKITFHIDALFIMEIDFDDIDNYEEIYYYENKYYTNYNEFVDSNVIYINSLDIINNGIRIK